MDILIIGGTVFLGRALVEAGLQRGHHLTLFNRGRSNPELFPAVEKLTGERDGGLNALHGRRWDAVIDTCGYFPRVVRQSARLLSDACQTYSFISSLSVYADFSQMGIDEDAPLARLAAEPAEKVTHETYGPLKALCEEEVQAAFPGRALIIRPGLIVGPHDTSDRFTYWPVRVAEGGEVLAPGRPDRPVQLIDVRDLAEWNIRMVEQAGTGVYNANGPAQPLPIGDVLEACRQVSGSAARFTWVSEDFLLQQKVGPWTELTLWMPESDPELAGFFSFAIDRAVSAGLTFRPVADTAQATLEWAATRPPDYPWHAGLAREREAELLAAWHAKQG